MAIKNLPTQAIRYSKTALTKMMAQTLQDFSEGYKLEPSIGKVYGQDYYCVRPYGFMWDNIIWADFADWCKENMGSCGSGNENCAALPNHRWYDHHGRFWFRDEKDRIMFIMRWS